MFKQTRRCVRPKVTNNTADQPVWSPLWAHTHQYARDLYWLLKAPAFWPGAHGPDHDHALEAAPLFGQALWPRSQDASMAQWLHAQATTPSALVHAVQQALAHKPSAKRLLHLSKHPSQQANKQTAPYLASQHSGQPNPPRLGRLAEALMDYAVRQSPAFQWQASSIKLFECNANGQPTATQLGELDYVWRDDLGQLVHCELAVKFYALAHESALLGGDWQQSALQAIGPDGHENWQHKWHKLTHQQLAHALPKPWANEPVQRLAHVRGRWFVPARSTHALRQWAATPHAPPEQWTALLGQGPWSLPSEAAREAALAPLAFSGHTARFGPRTTWAQARSLRLPARWQCRLLQRAEWLGPVSQGHCHDLHGPNDLRAPDVQPGQRPRVQMLGVFAFDDHAQAWCEQWRAWIDASVSLQSSHDIYPTPKRGAAHQ